MGLAVMVSDDTNVDWIKETLTLVNIRVSRGSARKPLTKYATSKDASIKTITEAGDWIHT